MLPGDLNWWEPADLGVIAWTYPNYIAGTSNFTPTLGNVYAVRIPLPPAPVTISNITVGVGVAGGTLTAGQNLLGLYDNRLQLLAVSGDQAATWQSTGSPTAAIGPVNLSGIPYCYVAFLTNGTTAPQFARTGFGTGGAPFAWRNATFPNAPCFQHSVGSLTAMPAALSPNAGRSGALVYADLS